MSDVLDRIRRELQQRLESTRAAAQEHERVRGALEALEHATKPVERATRRAAGEATRRGRGVVARARPARGADASATTRSGTGAAAAQREPRPPARRATGSRGPAAASRGGRKEASASTAKAGAAARTPARARARAKPSRARAPRGANREAVLAVIRERPGVTASELAAASGVSGGTLYSLLRRLIEQGELAKRELPGGQMGYTLAADDADVKGGVGRDADSEASSQARTAEDASTAEPDTAPRAGSPPHAGS